MAEQFRTTVSAVFWTDTPEQAEAFVAELASVLPEGSSDPLSTIEYIAAGKPPPLEPAEPDIEGVE